MKKIISILSTSLCFFNYSAQTTHTVNAGSYYYTPTNLTVQVGDSVIWINDGGLHDVNGNINSITNQPFNNPVNFDSPSTNTAGAVIFAYKFTVAGTYNYDCSVGSHAANGMVGSVIVTGPSTNINIANTNYLIYPNPTSEFVYLSGINRDSKSKVYDITGKLLQSTREKKIDLSSYPNGLYMINIHSNNGFNIHRIIKE
jgi:plastocyanin